ncbi:methyltransferase domain-containing protein [Thermodesulforhabdus norvegica]|uniref:methyltransferase domain-containing protein n=1 Tax=Thermodesulforhabdus norvegica TaxID=39841 RepID=UPI0015A56899|nr:methyltransferase domain-containing protein [Thermodesulforhabdus norvegica]
MKSYYRELYRGKINPTVKVCSGSVLARRLGYSLELLDWLTDHDFPWDYIHPCGNPVRKGLFEPGDFVLNLGCGIGLDACALMFEATEELKAEVGYVVVNVDVVSEVLERACRWVASLRELPDDFTLLWVCADALKLPFTHETFDVVLMNGVFNVFPDKKLLLEELRRVIKKGGRLVIADIFVSTSLPDYVKTEPDAWAWCIAGALTEEEFFELLRSSGFGPCRGLDKEAIDDAFYRGVFAAERVS